VIDLTGESSDSDVEEVTTWSSSSKSITGRKSPSKPATATHTTPTPNPTTSTSPSHSHTSSESRSLKIPRPSPGQELAGSSVSGVGLGLITHSRDSPTQQPQGLYHPGSHAFTTLPSVSSPQTRNKPTVRQISRDAQNRPGIECAHLSLPQAASDDYDMLKRAALHRRDSWPDAQPHYLVEEANHERRKRKAEEGFDVLLHVAARLPRARVGTVGDGQIRIGGALAMSKSNHIQGSFEEETHTAMGARRVLAATDSHLFGHGPKRARTSVATDNDKTSAGIVVRTSTYYLNKETLNNSPVHAVPPPLTVRPPKIARPPEVHGRVRFDELLKSAEAEASNSNRVEATDIASGIIQAKRLSSHAVDKAVEVLLSQHNKRRDDPSPRSPVALHPPPLLKSATPEHSPAGNREAESALPHSSPVALFSTHYPPVGIGLKPRIVPVGQDAPHTSSTVISPSKRNIQPSSVLSQKTILSSALSSVPLSSATSNSASRRGVGADHLIISVETTPRFAESRMPDMKGNPFTFAEMFMVGYLQEEKGMSWSGVDHKMGRTTNSCASKYLRKPHGMKSPEVKKKFFYYDRINALDAIIFTLDPNISEAVQMLQDFIDSGSLPTNASASLFATLQASRIDSQSADIKLTGKPESFIDGSHSIQGSLREPTPTLHPPVVPRNSDSVSTTFEGFERQLRPSARTAAGNLSVRKFFDALLDEAPTPSEQSSWSISLADNESDNLSIVPVSVYPEGAFIKRQRPYLSFSERNVLKKSLETLDWKLGDASGWEDASLHVDFDNDELEELCLSIYTKIGKNDAKVPLAERISSSTRGLSPAQVRNIAGHAKRCGYLEHRTTRSVETFLRDVAKGLISCKQPTALHTKLFSQNPSPLSIKNQLLRREMSQRGSQRRIQDTAYGVMNPTLTFTGASGDIGTLAWSPDGNLFAAGAACLVDENSMQYNRPNNLLFGNVAHSELLELPHHSRPRVRTESGVNSTHSMHESQDPRLFETVSMVDFSPQGSFMYSTGYDLRLRAYEIIRDRPELRWESDHGAKLDLLTTSRNSGLIAIGCQSNEDSIKVYRNESGRFDGPTVLNTQRTEKKTSPSSLRWGVHNYVQNYLLAGFAAVHEDVQYGEICLWDIERKIPITVTPSAGTIFDCNWSPAGHVFATACSAHGMNANRGVHSFVRIYSAIDDNRWSKGVELDCPARDINDVVFCPHDQNYVAAGATDGRVYVWDIRNPNFLLHKLEHGNPIMELDPTVPRELSDTGVRFCAWNYDRSQLHTGASDGVVKVWDIFRSPKDAFVKDSGRFNSGVYSGAFNIDFSSLLIGEINGSLNVLEAGKEHSKNVEQFQFKPALEQDSASVSSSGDENIGIKAGKALRKSKQIKFRALGGLPMRQAVQGKKYVGPYDGAADADDLRARATEFQSRMKVANPENLCQIPHCRDAAFRATAEEDGDSGRSLDRIPQTLRQTNEVQSKMITGMMKCSHCGSPARPRLSELEQVLFPLCERCGFSCFRCEERVKVSVDAKKIHCRACDLTWDVGVLGYELIHSKVKSKSKVSATKEAHADADGLGDMGDLLHLVEEYHQSLWQDRPPSPL
jgi:WD40 repeat protein